MNGRQYDSGEATPALRLREVGHLVGQDGLDPAIDARPAKSHDRTQQVNRHDVVFLSKDNDVCLPSTSMLLMSLDSVYS